MARLESLPSVLLGSLGAYITPGETHAIRTTCRALRWLQYRQSDWIEQGNTLFGGTPLIDQHFVLHTHSSVGPVQPGFSKLKTIHLHQMLEDELLWSDQIRHIQSWMISYPNCLFVLNFRTLPKGIVHLDLSCVIQLTLTGENVGSLLPLSALQALESLTLISVDLSALVADVTSESRPLSVKFVGVRLCPGVTKAAGFWPLVPFIETLKYAGSRSFVPLSVRTRLLRLTIPPCEVSGDYCRLVSLTVDWQVDDEAQLVLGNLKNLLHLRITLATEFIADLPALVSLQVRCVWQTSKVFTYPSCQLKKLHVDYYRWCASSLQDNFAALFPALTELCVSNVERCEMSVHVLPPLLQTLCLSRVGLACLGLWHPRNLRNFCYIDCPLGVQRVRVHLPCLLVNQSAYSMYHQEHLVCV